MEVSEISDPVSLQSLPNHFSDHGTQPTYLLSPGDRSSTEIITYSTLWQGFQCFEGLNECDPGDHGLLRDLEIGEKLFGLIGWKGETELG